MKSDNLLQSCSPLSAHRTQEHPCVHGIHTGEYTPMRRPAGAFLPLSKAQREIKAYYLKDEVLPQKIKRDHVSAFVFIQFYIIPQQEPSIHRYTAALESTGKLCVQKSSLAV